MYLKNAVVLTSLLFVFSACSDSDPSYPTFDSSVDGTKSLNNLSEEETRLLGYEAAHFGYQAYTNPSWAHQNCMMSAWEEDTFQACQNTYDMCIEVGYAQFEMVEEPPSDIEDPFFDDDEDSLSDCNLTVGRLEECISLYFQTSFQYIFSSTCEQLYGPEEINVPNAEELSQQLASCGRDLGFCSVGSELNMGF